MSRRAMTFTVTIPLPGLVDPLTGMRRAVVTLWYTLMVWQRRAQERRQLLEMSDHMRRDIGLTAEQCRDEARKPFWMV